jgi:hypothetical protein
MNEFKLRGLLEKQAVATCKLRAISPFVIKTRKTSIEIAGRSSFRMPN